MKRTALLAAAAALSGCITIHETPYPQTAMTPVKDGMDISVSIQGFTARITDYVPVYGYDTIWVEGRPSRGRHGWVPGHYRTVSSSTYLPQIRDIDEFLQRANSLAEAAGFVTKAQQPDYMIEVKFGGPFITDEERGVEALWALLSVLSADYGVHTWTANLKIYDNRTGKLLFHNEYSQRYEIVVWGPIPLLSPAGSSKNTFSAMQCWCLGALTDRAMADASSFLSSKGTKPLQGNAASSGN